MNQETKIYNKLFSNKKDQPLELDPSPKVKEILSLIQSQTNERFDDCLTIPSFVKKINEIFPMPASFQNELSKKFSS